VNHSTLILIKRAGVPVVDSRISFPRNEHLIALSAHGGVCRLSRHLFAIIVVYCRTYGVDGSVTLHPIPAFSGGILGGQRS
ncbi:MAG: hypothetical protein WAK55_10240, partial [Xanthobacteraceae bacterium]